MLLCIQTAWHLLRGPRWGVEPTWGTAWTIQAPKNKLHECHRINQFEEWTGPLDWNRSKVIPYKAVKLEGYGSRDWNDLSDLRFYIQAGRNKISQSTSTPWFVGPQVVPITRSALKARAVAIYKSTSLKIYLLFQINWKNKVFFKNIFPIIFLEIA